MCVRARVSVWAVEAQTHTPCFLLTKIFLALSWANGITKIIFEALGWNHRARHHQLCRCSRRRQEFHFSSRFRFCTESNRVQFHFLFSFFLTFVWVSALNCYWFDLSFVPIDTLLWPIYWVRLNAVAANQSNSIEVLRIVCWLLRCFLFSVRRTCNFHWTHDTWENITFVVEKESFPYEFDISPHRCFEVKRMKNEIMFHKSRIKSSALDDFQRTLFFPAV